mmetsp:Transcript_34662/g.55435  ORF Transcript_34662/g.55435 Transcript_34662/m.55435 type:complete len:592 (+) Transcript_34662:136-1911(+)
MWPFSSDKAEEPGAVPADVKPVPVNVDEKPDTSSERIFIDDPKDEAKEPEKGSMPGFDATGLERAAKAARELEGLKYAQEAVNIAKAKEDRRAKQALAEIEENKARAKAFEAEQVRVREDERRKTLQTDHKMKQEQSYYQDQLARKRHQDQLNAQAAMKEQQLKREEDFQLRVEAMKRQTAEYEAKLRKDTERARAQAEMEGRTVQERKNWDLHMQRSRMEAKEYRTTVLESVKEAGSIIGHGFNDFLNDKQKMGTTIGGLSLLAIGIYGARVSTGVLGRFIESRLGKPPLVRETSRHSPLDAIRHPIKSYKNMVASRQSALQGIVVEPTLKERLANLAVSTKNTKRNGAPYRNMMLYGPPGTGKTMFAKQLAQSSGMDYAIMTGGDVAPLGRDAVTEMHKIFDWANTSNKGLMLFVDEADAFLRKRSDKNMSEDLRNALNAFLYRTGTETKNFQVVFATNEPDDLDRAINDRTDELVNFNLPGTNEREEMMRVYFEKYVRNASSGAGLFSKAQEIIVDESVDENVFADFAKRTEGFSGREISKLGIAWQAAAYGTQNCTLTKDLMTSVLESRLEQHLQKTEWENLDQQEN